MQIGGWCAGVSALALWAGAAQGQQSTPAGEPTTLATPRAATPQAGAEGQPTRQRIARDAQGVFRDAQGNPVSPEIQRMIEEQLRANTTSAAEPAAADGEIVVTGDRPRGSVIGDVPPERSFDTLSVRAFGATDVSELLDAIGPQVRSNRGRADAGPVTLLNGRRVSSFAEIARIPTEAIERMDVFPEELAPRYGFRADQKVVNIVTFPNFRSVVAQANGLTATEGGTGTGGVSVDQLLLRGDTRFGIGATLSATGALTEGERDLLQPGGGREAAVLRTLLPRADRLSLNAVVAAPLLAEVGGSLNAQFDGSDLSGLLGPDGLGGVVRRETRSRRGRLGTVFDGRVGRWLWSFTGGYDRTAVDVLTEGSGAAPAERVRSVNAVADADLVASGPLFALPAGPVTASIGGGVGARDFRGTGVRGDDFDLTRLGRDRATARANIDLPIAREGTAVIGALAANVGAEVERLSDVGTLTVVNAGLTWTPVPALDVVASVTREEGAPTVEQLGAPTIVTPAARSFDFATGRSVDVPRIFGGNPDLVADERRVLRVGVSVTPVPRTDLSFSVDYVDTRIDDSIAAFPILTPALEAAFPERFQRDTGGLLTAIDARPVNFAGSALRQLRTGINFTRPLGDPMLGLPPGSTVSTRVYASREEAEAAVRRRNPGATVVFGGPPEPGSAAARRGETLRSRFYISLYHNWTLADEVTLVGGGPVLDRLDGFATDLRGGRRRHEIDFQLGAFKSGFGGRLAINWQSATRIDGLGGTGDLAFAPFGRVDLTLFLNPAERLGGTEAPDWIKRTRVTLGITNLLNERPEVRDDTGATPLAFLPALIDPLGRAVSLTLRKAF